MSLREKLEKDLPRLIRQIDRAMRRKNILHRELTRLRSGESEEIAAARLRSAGIRR